LSGGILSRQSSSKRGNLEQNSSKRGNLDQQNDDPNSFPSILLRALVVDDSLANRKMLFRLLKLDKHITVEAEDGLAAVGIISRSLLKRDINENEDAPIHLLYLRRYLHDRISCCDRPCS
jgi:hypothetical protein